MATSEKVRIHPRFQICWPIIYCGEDFIGKGTMVDVSLQGGRFAGTMPVEPGMRLGLYVDAPHKADQLLIEEAVVTWVSEDEFGMQFVKMRTHDLQWLAGYLEIAERRNSFRQLLGMSTTMSEAAALPLALPLKG